MDTEAVIHPFMVPPQILWNSPDSNASVYSGYSSRPSSCPNNIIDAALKAPDVTTKGKKRSRSDRSSTSNDSGYYDDTTASKISRLSRNSQDHLLDLTRIRLSTVAEARSNHIQNLQPSVHWGCGHQFTQADTLGGNLRFEIANTDIASALDGMRTLELVDRVLQLPDISRPHADLICPWQILDCEETFNDIRLWKTHVFAHFRGHQCPKTATCFLCERVFNQSLYDDSTYAWNEMLSYMATEHFRGMGQRLTTIQTGFGLMRWMYNRRIITATQFSKVVNMPEALLAPSPASPSSSPPVERGDVYTVQATSRRERTRRARARELIENSKTEEKTIIEEVAESNANCHGSWVSRRAASALSYPEPPVDLVFKSYQHPCNVPDNSGITPAEADCVPNSLPTGQHADNELGVGTLSFSGGSRQTEVTLVQEEASRDDEKDKLTDEEGWPLSPDERSPISDYENGYESTSERSISNYSQKALISRLMDEICSSFFFQVHHCRRKHERKVADSFSSDSTQSSNNTMDFNNNNSSANQEKRARKGDDDSEDEVDGKRKRRRSKESISSDNPLTEVRYFACPFHKFNVSTYSNRNGDPRLALKYRSCGPPGWPTIGKMKEHLYRSHQTPIHCPRCWTVMKTEAALGEHVRASSQCNILPQPLRWIPREVYIKLKDRKKAFTGQTDEDTWRYIFGLIFPDSMIVPGPYYDKEVVPEDIVRSGSPTTQAIAAYEEYARAHLPRLVEEALETSVAEQTQPIEENLRRALAGIVRDCHTRLAQTFLQHRSSNPDDAAVQIGALPSFYIEPLSLTDENSFLDPDYGTTHEQGAPPGPQTDSGYSSVSVNQSFGPDSRELGLRAPSLQDDDFGSFYGHDRDDVTTNLHFGNQTTMLEDCDWAAILGSSSNDDYVESSGLRAQ